MSRALDMSEKEVIQLVEFTNDKESLFYTDWTSDYVYEGETYVSTPDMEVKLPVNDGLFTEQDCRVALPLSDDPEDFTQTATCGLPYPPTHCTVREIIRPMDGGPQSSVHVTFQGRLAVYRRNYNGNRKKVVLQSLPIKSRISTVALGVPCNHQCGNNLGDAGCKVNMDLHSSLVTITAIDGREVTINAAPQGKPDRYYHRGYFAFDGLHLGIREWRNAASGGDETKFFVVRRPPSYWLGKQVRVFAGCDKSPETCGSRFNNLENFLGLGFSMPAYHPNFESQG